MTDSRTHAAPELEHLLTELAARPRSIFLRADRKAAFRALRSGTEERVSGFAVPDVLERELVRVHRAELAEIVHQAIRTRLLDGARERMFIMHYRGANERAEATGLADIRTRLRAATATTLDEPWAGAIAALQRAVSPEDPEGLSVLDLAALGQRLEAREAWRVNSALWYLAQEEHDAACALARRVLDGWPSTESALRTFEILAIAEASHGDPTKALGVQEKACALREDYPVGQANRFLFAIQSGREAEASDASELLERLVEPEHDLIRGFVLAVAQRRRSGTWVPTRYAPRTVRRLESGIGRVARRLASVFQ